MKFKNYSDLTPEEVRAIALHDCEIPLLYEIHFKTTESVLNERIKYYEELVQNGFFRAVIEGEKILAFHAISLKEEEGTRWAHIGTFWVHPDYRGQGIGGKLKADGEAWASSVGCKFIQTGVNHNNERMLEINRKHGYEVFAYTLRKKLQT